VLANEIRDGGFRAGPINITGWGSGRSNRSQNRATENLDATRGSEGPSGNLTEFQEAFIGIRDLDVSAGLMLVEIREWNGDDIVVDTSGLHSDLQGRIDISARNDRLTVSTERVRNWVNIGNVNNDVLLIYLPEDLELRSASLSVGAGELVVEDIDADHLIIEIGAGSGWVGEFSSYNVEVNVGLGSLTMSGEVETRIEISCGMGDVTLNLEGEESDFGYEVNVGMGSARIGNFSLSGMGRSAQNSVHREPFILIDVGMGSVDVNFYD